MRGVDLSFISLTSSSVSLNFFFDFFSTRLLKNPCNSRVLRLVFASSFSVYLLNADGDSSSYFHSLSTIRLSFFESFFMSPFLVSSLAAQFQVSAFDLYVAFLTTWVMNR